MLFWIHSIFVPNSALKWSEWITLGSNSLNLTLQYRYNKFMVEINIRGTIPEGKNLTYGTEGYKFPNMPASLKPSWNMEVPIYGVYNDLCVQMFPENRNFWTIMSNKTITTTEEYVAVNFVYGI